MKLWNRIRKYACPLSVGTATCLMLAAMLISLFLVRTDRNGNGLSDAEDLVLGARAAIEATRSTMQVTLRGIRQKPQVRVPM